MNKRKQIRIKDFDYSTAGAYFVTVCTKDRNKILWQSAPTLSTVVGSLKRWASKQVKNSIWQKSFFDHAIRNEQDYREISEYIENNPLEIIK